MMINAWFLSSCKFAVQLIEVNELSREEIIFLALF